MKLTFSSIEMVLLVSACGFLLNTNKPSSVSAMNTPRKLCGADLVEVLQAVCQVEGYFSPTHKRFGNTDTEDVFNNQLPSDSFPYLSKADSFPYLSKADSFPYLSKSAASIWAKRGSLSRMSEGIVQECCYRQCTMTELTRYCQRDPTARLNNLSTNNGMARAARDY